MRSGAEGRDVDRPMPRAPGALVVAEGAGGGAVVHHPGKLEHGCVPREWNVSCIWDKGR